MTFLILQIFFFGKILLAQSSGHEFLDFALPPEWSCAPEGQEWVCLDRKGAGYREGLIVVVVKQRSPTDSWAEIRHLLGNPKMTSEPSGPPRSSVVLGLEELTLHGAPWFRAIHKDAELTDYFTYYYAHLTTTHSLLLSFTFHSEQEAKFKAFAGVLEQSLKIKSAAASGISPQAMTAPAPTEAVPEADPKGSRLLLLILGFALVLLGFGLFRKK